MWIPTVKDIGRVVEQPDRLLAIKENATVAEAAKKMSDNQIGSLVVFNTDGKFAGVLTERDMLKKVLATYLAPTDLLVREIMTNEPIFCGRDTTIEKVEQLMAEHKIRHVPIVKDGVPIGMVSSRDVIAYQLHSNKAMKAAAEQLALLSTQLKSLNLKDVTTLAIEEVPRSFEAGQAVLCFAQKPSSGPVIYRKDCQLSRKNLLEPEKMTELSTDGRVIYGQICEHCSKAGGRQPRLIIPLNIHDQTGADEDASTQSFLCMCRFDPASNVPEKLRLYKASLLQEVLSVNLTNAKLYYNYQKARRDSETDPLTGLSTRRVLEEVLKAEYARAIRYHHYFSVAIIDLDKLKQINDNAGHAAGDETLRKLADIMRLNIRTTDIVIARYGGDEFVLLMPETKLNEATILLERLRRQISETPIPGIGPMTISCGAAEWAGSAEDTPETMLLRADAALYEAKNAGRNCVVTAAKAQQL